MSFLFNKTKVNDLLVINPHVFIDNRGIYKKIYEKDIFLENNICCDFTETSDIYSHKGVLRGLHYQTENSQAKLIHVISGVLYDVALDLRKESSTFGKYHAEILDSKENKVVFIPPGFAHGFLALTEDTIFSYQCSGKYLPEACGGIKWNDPDLNIPWPIKEFEISQVILTDKDKNWPTLSEYKKMNGIDWK